MNKDFTDQKLKEAKILEDYKISNDINLLGLLYKNYMPLVYGVCLKYLKNAEDSQDAVMQIFEELVIKLKEHTVINFKSWLYVLTRNYCLMKLRTDAQRSFHQIDDVDMESHSFLHHIEETAVKEEMLTALEKCIKTLNNQQQESIRLFYLEKKCYTEVAKMTGYEVNKVKSYIQNGKRNLKICLENKQA